MEQTLLVIRTKNAQYENLEMLFQQVAEYDCKTSFEEIFRRMFKPLCTLANGLVKNHEAAEEIVDDVFFSLWKNRKKIVISISFQSYLLTSVRNRSFDFLRKMKSEKSAVILERAYGMPCNQYMAHEKLAYEELSSNLETAILRLPKQCRRIFLMSREDELKYKEISKILNISVKTVDTQMGRALKHLRKAVSR
jgi:RNA polymerase sigma-70 factor (ECF subfamily)